MDATITITLAEAGRRVTVAGDAALFKRLLDTIGHTSNQTAGHSAENGAPALAMTSSAPGAAHIALSEA